MKKMRWNFNNLTNEDHLTFISLKKENLRRFWEWKTVESVPRCQCFKSDEIAKKKIFCILIPRKGIFILRNVYALFFMQLRCDILLLHIFLMSHFYFFLHSNLRAVSSLSIYLFTPFFFSLKLWYEKRNILRRTVLIILQRHSELFVSHRRNRRFNRL